MVNNYRTILHWLPLLVLIVVAGLLTACSGDRGSAPPQDKRQRADLMLMFQEQETDIQPYPTRVIISDRFVRMDDGKAAGGFVLFDRKKDTVYSVSRDNRAILVVQGKPVKVESPIPLVLDARKTEHPDAPMVDGKRPVQYSLLVNGKVCTNVMVVPGLLPDAVVALREFRRALAGQHAEDLSKTPVKMLDPCFLADHIFAPARYLQYGFPIRKWDANGKSRTLVDYDTDYKADPKLFDLPDGYRREKMGPKGVSVSPRA